MLISIITILNEVVINFWIDLFDEEDQMVLPIGNKKDKEGNFWEVV